MPAGFSEREREAIRRKLRSAALNALARGGLAAASVSELAEEADIAKGSFYSFYSTKEHLFMEALETIEDEYRSRFAAAAAGPGSPAERLERAFAAAFEMAASEPTLRHLDTRTLERLARALPPGRVEEHEARDAEAIGRIAAGWRREGLLAKGTADAEVAAAGYAVFLVSAGLDGFPAELRGAVRIVTARGLALALAAPGRTARNSPKGWASARRDAGAADGERRASGGSE
ncbi:MAG TPA: TetR/AcrR family transcriptional regulator [Magnetospirillaceae bacterium]|nr:TetR/AcrR family transcriptional regulator [Magnetospirillaceae bacterium]